MPLPAIAAAPAAAALWSALRAAAPSIARAAAPVARAAAPAAKNTARNLLRKAMASKDILARKVARNPTVKKVTGSKPFKAGMTGLRGLAVLDQGTKAALLASDPTYRDELSQEFDRSKDKGFFDRTLGYAMDPAGTAYGFGDALKAIYDSKKDSKKSREELRKAHQRRRQEMSNSER